MNYKILTKIINNNCFSQILKMNRIMISMILMMKQINLLIVQFYLINLIQISKMKLQIIQIDNTIIFKSILY